MPQVALVPVELLSLNTIGCDTTEKLPGQSWKLGVALAPVGVNCENVKVGPVAPAVKLGELPKTPEDGLGRSGASFSATIHTWYGPVAGKLPVAVKYWRFGAS